MINHSPYCKELDEYVDTPSPAPVGLNQEVLVDDSKIFLVTQQDVIQDWVERRQLPNDKDIYCDALILLEVMDNHYPWYLSQGCPNDVY